MRTASAISTALHVVALLWAALSLSGQSYIVPPAESLPVDFISDKQFSELTKGVKDAPKPVEKPKPVVEKKADVSKPVDDLKPKVTEKKELKPAAEKAPEPPPQPEPKSEPKKAAEKPPEPKPDPIAKKIEQPAEKIEQPAEKKEAKADPAPLPRRKPPMRQPPKEAKQPKFDADKIAALLDKREPQRMAATGETLNPNAGLGRVNGQAPRLSQSELDALRRRIASCWNPPVGAEHAQDLTVVFRVIFNPDGTVKRGPDVVEGAASSFGPVFAESAKRAILQCQPYTMLRRETYNIWRDMEMAFRPSDMFR